MSDAQIAVMIYAVFGLAFATAYVCSNLWREGAVSDLTHKERAKAFCFLWVFWPIPAAYAILCYWMTLRDYG